MLERWARTVARRRWWVLVAALALIALAGTASMSLTDRLQQGGYDVPGSGSARADDTIKRAVGKQTPDAVAVYTATNDGRLVDPGIIRSVQQTIDDLPAKNITKTTGWWDQPTLASRDGRTAAVAIQLDADDQGELVDAWKPLEEKLRADTDLDGITVRFTGYAALGTAITEQTESDLVKAESISFPVLLVLLVLVFGGLIAAGLPLVVGGIGIVGALGVLWVLTTVTDVSVFAMNVVTLLGLGLAIDYGLFIVTRFREELHNRSEAPEDITAALTTTLRTAGRTVLISGLTVAAALSGLLVFPQMMLRSIALGGIAAVVVAALSAVTVLPALLAVLGRRVDALRIPFRRRSGAGAGNDRGWGRIGRLVMRRPAVVSVVVVAGLLAIGLPFLRAEYGEADASMLPKDNDVRIATEQLRDELPSASDDAVQLVLVGSDGTAPSEQSVQAFAGRVSDVDGVRQVVPSAAGDDVAVLSAPLESAPQGNAAQDAVRELRSLDPPSGVDEVIVGGPTARLMDTVDAIGDNVPWMVLVIALAVLVLLFLAFGSLVLPIKAIVLSALSLTASFGATVWIFQDGHFVSWLGTEAGPIEASMPVLMLAVLFGLSTDYELFLLSRIAEAYRSGRTPKDAVVHGLSRTGPLISAAAVLLGVVIGAFALGDTKFMKLLGVGMLIAILVDATIVRGLLVPAILALLGRAAWWAPGPLARFAGRVALEPSEGPAHERPREPAGIT